MSDNPDRDQQDDGYWCFTRQQLDKLLAGLEDRAAAVVLQALDSPDARRFGLHHLPPGSRHRPQRIA